MSLLRRALVGLALGCATTTAYDNGYGLKPFLGWQSWCAVGKCGTDACYDRQIRQTAKAMATNGMKDLGFEWVVIDVRALPLDRSPSYHPPPHTPPPPPPTASPAPAARAPTHVYTNLTPRGAPGLLAPHPRCERHARPV